MRNYSKISCFLILMAFLIISGRVEAADFDPNYLISDSEITNYSAMDINDIQKFLEKRVGILKSYVATDNNGNQITAAEAFYQAALNARINPQYLLVLVQKEMSLLDDVDPTSSQLDWATGYGCPDGGSCNPRWQGFFKQVNSAALQTRDYVDSPHNYYYRPGITAVIDNTPVTPKNAATAGLYSYTPHIDCGGSCGGNKLFWNLWSKFFSKKWPDGALLRSEDGTTYYIENGKKRQIVSKAVFASRFDENKVISVSDADLSYYEAGPPIKYLNFSLLKNSRGEIYMIVDNAKRQFEDWEIFQKIGFMADEVITVPDSELDLYENGAKITKYTIYPTGKLLQDKKTKEIYYVINGKKKLVANKEILNFNFQGLPITKTTAVELDEYRAGNPVTLPDGELIKIKGSNTVYAVSNGKILPIHSGKIFLAMNYDWKNILTVSQQTLEVHQLGQTIIGNW